MGVTIVGTKRPLNIQCQYSLLGPQNLLFYSGSEFYAKTYTLTASMGKVQIWDGKCKIKMQMKEVGSQTPQNNMKCQYKKMKAQTNQERNTEAKVKIMKNDTVE